jgi:hypothetical protein
MEEKKVKIIPPEGWEIDIEKSNLSTGDIVYQEIVKNKLPKSWGELKTIQGCWIAKGSKIGYDYNITCTNDNKNIFPTKEYAEAVLALAQLLQLRERYIGDWKPDWTNPTIKHGISNISNKLDECSSYYTNKVLSFPTQELRDEFYNNFQELLETAKPLL